MNATWALLLASAIPLSAGATNDWLIVPGERVGPIVMKATRQDLVEIFGKENVVNEEMAVEEEETRAVSLVFKSKLDAQLTVVWTEDQDNPHIAQIHICPGVRSGKCKWHAADDIGFGTDLLTLEKLNGRPFTLFGFGWDYGGAVSSFNGGELDRLLPTCGKLGLSLDAGEVKDRAVYDQVVGDHEFPSSHTAMQALNPVVTAMRFSSCEE